MAFALQSRGWPSDADVAAFAAAGYGPRQALEVILGIGIKTMSNYTNHITVSPPDRVFSPAAWSKVA
jgi:alkylhydroperoxidase family enzyme